eukprot:jgi/Phyca11/12764/fgenesh1_pg.PHYCAscaffold_1_\
MLLLNCAIIGGGDVISIIIEEWKTVALLKDAIKEKKPIKLNDVDAGDLHLFLAKKDGAWLMSDDLLQMREDGKGERGYMSEELKDPVAKISAKFPSELPDGSIHVLVVQRFRIEDVIDILAELEKIDDVKNMTVILCVDALQQLVNDDAKTRNGQFRRSYHACSDDMAAI